MKQVSIRGATTVPENSSEEIKKACVEMVQNILEQNGITPDDIITIFMTMTEDLTALNASAAVRTGLGFQDLPFFTSQEPNVDGMLARCIRILIQCYSDKSKTEISHIYLNEAAKLRPDLKK